MVKGPSWKGGRPLIPVCGFEPRPSRQLQQWGEITWKWGRSEAGEVLSAVRVRPSQQSSDVLPPVWWRDDAREEAMMSATTRRKKKREEMLRARRRARDMTLEPKERCTAYCAVAVCGCCTVGPMYFLSPGSIKRAFKKMGLTVWGHCVDDIGVEHSGIDTFYGYREWRVGDQVSNGA